MKQAVFFVYVWPEPRSSAAGVRTRELMALLQGEGYEVHAVSPSGAGPYREELEAAGVRTYSCDPNVSPPTEETFRSLSPELVVFDRFVMEEQFGWRARESWPRAFFVVDTQDLHSLRRARERTSNPTIDELGEDLLRELGSLHRAGAALVVSPFERELLVEKLGFPSERVAWVPFSASPDHDPAPFSARKGFCFLGNFRHPPNLDSVSWLLAEHWPLIRAKMPGAELHLYGAYPPSAISAHKGANGIFAHGPVADHRAALRRHRALLAPLRFGAGIKGKVLEAWASGTPALGTALTFEGMGEAGLAAENAAALAELACAVHDSEPVWSAELGRARSSLEKHFTPRAVKEAFFSFLDAAPRECGLTGRMLRHHGLNASKYFSRWIEAKNRSRDGILPP